jgi:hypothetical protein
MKNLEAPRLGTSRDSGRASLPAGIDPLDGGGQLLDSSIGQRLLDHREEDALLMADVALEPLAELVQFGRAGSGLVARSCARQRRSTCSTNTRTTAGWSGSPRRA